MIILNVGDKFPKTCEHCPLFVDHMGIPTYCVGGGEYTEEEIEAKEDGELNMYYKGCLSKRPQNCPLKEVEDEPHWIDLTDYCPTAYGFGDDPHEPNWNYECSKCGSHIFTEFTPDKCPNCKADMKGVEGGKA